MTISYRKDKKTDTFKLFGPVSEMRVGPVKVTTKSGEIKDEVITKLSKPFDADGEECCFGEMAPREARHSAPRSEQRSKTPRGGSGRRPEGPRTRYEGEEGDPSHKDANLDDPNVLLELAARENFRV